MLHPRDEYDADAAPKQRRYRALKYIDPLMEEQTAIYKAALKRRKGKKCTTETDVKQKTATKS